MLLLLRSFYVFYVFKIQKNVTFYVFLLCCIRFLELYGHGILIAYYMNCNTVGSGELIVI